MVAKEKQSGEGTMPIKRERHKHEKMRGRRQRKHGDVFVRL